MLSQCSSKISLVRTVQKSKECLRESKQILVSGNKPGNLNIQRLRNTLLNEVVCEQSAIQGKHVKCQVQAIKEGTRIS